MSEEKKHATLGASSAKRWLNCSGSVALIEKAPPQVESEYAKEGTTAHDLMESLLVSIPGKIVQVALDGFKKKYGKEMYGHIFKMYVALSKIRKHYDDMLVEERVDLDIIGPDMYGTVDYALIEHFGLLHIGDLKYGAGIAVEPKDNWQLIYYALGIAAKYKFNFTRVRMTIYQPRAFHPDGPWRSWEISIEELKEFIPLFKKGVDRVNGKSKTSLFSGEWCRFCPAAVICPEVVKNALAQAKIDFAPEVKKDFALPNPKDLSPEQMQIIMRKLDGIEAWITNVKSYAFDLMDRGGKIDGFKLVSKRAQRQWGDLSKAEKEARKEFGDEAFTEPKLKTPAALEEIGASKEWVNKRTVSISSGLTIVKESDIRKQASSVHEDFNDDLTKEKSNAKSRKEKSIGKKGYEKSYEESSKESWKKSSKKEVLKKVSGKKSKSADHDYGF